MGLLMGFPAIICHHLMPSEGLNPSARVVKLVDTADLKSASLHIQTAQPDVVSDGARATD